MCFRLSLDGTDLRPGPRIAGIAALDQPLRRELYRLLGETESWLSRTRRRRRSAPRSVAAFHLDKLADAGVVEVTFAHHRPPGPRRRPAVQGTRRR